MNHGVYGQKTFFLVPKGVAGLGIVFVLVSELASWSQQVEDALSCDHFPFQYPGDWMECGQHRSKYSPRGNSRLKFLATGIISPCTFVLGPHQAGDQHYAHNGSTS